MSVLLGNEHTPSPGSLKKTNKQKNMADISLSVKQTLLKNADGEHTQIVSSTGMTHVNMHPEVVFLADICYAVQWIECTLHCGPWCATNKERHCALRKKNKVRWGCHPTGSWRLYHCSHRCRDKMQYFYFTKLIHMILRDGCIHSIYNI